MNKLEKLQVLVDTLELDVARNVMTKLIKTGNIRMFKDYSAGCSTYCSRNHPDWKTLNSIYEILWR